MRTLFAFVIALVLAGCYGPNSLDKAEPFYTGEISRPPMEVAECVQARYMLERNQVVTIVHDGDTVILSFGGVGGFGTLLWWRAAFTPGQVIVWSNEPIFDPVNLEWFKGCTA